MKKKDYEILSKYTDAEIKEFIEERKSKESLPQIIERGLNTTKIIVEEAAYGYDCYKLDFRCLTNYPANDGLKNSYKKLIDLETSFNEFLNIHYVQDGMEILEFRIGYAMPKHSFEDWFLSIKGRLERLGFIVEGV